MVAEPKK